MNRILPDSTIAEVLRLRGLGFSPRVIAVELNRRGVLTARRGRWTKAAVLYVVRKYRDFGEV